MQMTKNTQLRQQADLMGIVDNAPQWRKQLVEILNHSRSVAEAVATIQNALDILSQDIFYLLIADNEREDSDQSSRDRISLLSSLTERGTSEAPKIVALRAHDTKGQIYTALRDLSVADLKEDFNRQPSLEEICTAFDKQVEVNLNLGIFWIGTATEQAVCSLQIEDEQVDQDEILKPQVITELDDLLRRLFSNAESIIVRPLISTPSRSGMGVLSIQPFYPTGCGQAVVMKFGHLPRVKKEVEHFKDYVRPFVSGTRHTTIENTACTPLLGGIVYSLLLQGHKDEERSMPPPTLADMDASTSKCLKRSNNFALETTDSSWCDFGQFYQHNTTENITFALHHLFHETCGLWYANQGRLLSRNLTVDYCRQFGSSLEQLENTIKGTLPSITISRDHLSFTGLTQNRSFTNPFEAIRGRTFICPTYESITHGDLNQKNILVDNALGMWLIDFENTEHSHVLRDFATLDSVIRFQLLEAEEATLDERLAMEEALLSIAHFSQLERLLSAFKTENPALEKAYHTTCSLRMLARWAIDRNPRDDMNEYYVALLYNALFTLQFFSLSLRQREHAFLSASLLADKLTKKESYGTAAIGDRRRATARLR
jgi:Ternary complex associated domain 9